MSATARVLTVWCPDWPVAAGLVEQGKPRRLPAAVFAANRVVACNEAARALGVRRDMRRRDAQSRCPELEVLPADEGRDARAFEVVLNRLEELRPGVMPLRPGLVALRSPARYYGGEAEAGAVLAEHLVGLGVWDVRIGIADELFTAEQAARRTEPQQTRVVPAGESGPFLRGLPVEALEEPETVSLLRRLGLRTLGELARLGRADVRARFGARADWVRQVIHGHGARPVAGRTPPPELTREVGFEPPLESTEAVCFSARQCAENFVRDLAAQQLVATEVRLEVECEPDGQGHEVGSARHWLHPRWFDATALIDRLHWQLAGAAATGAGSSGRAAGRIDTPVTLVRFVPTETAPESAHADGLWGGTDERVTRGIARVQGLLGHDAVLAPVLQGGRGPAERQTDVVWGERPVALRDRSLPWPGSIPAPAPARVLREPWPAGVRDDAGRPVVVLTRQGVSAEPTRFVPGPQENWQPVAAWAGPWPVTEQWWEDGAARRLARCQLVGIDGRAWLLCFDCADGRWLTEAAYD